MNFINGIITSSSACSSPITTIETYQKQPPLQDTVAPQPPRHSSPTPHVPSAHHSKTPLALTRLQASASASALVLDAASSAQVSMENAIASQDPMKMTEELLKQV